MQNCDPKRIAMETALAAYQDTVQRSVSRVAEEEQRRMEGEQARLKPHATFEIDTEWENREITVPNVEVTMRPQEWIYKVPQVTMKRRELSFDFVGTRMVDKVVGKKPEVTCKWEMTKGPFGIKIKTWQCTTTWTDIITAVPEFYRERKTMVLSLPEVAMRETRTVLSVPEMELTEERIVLKLPQFRLRSVILNPDGAREDAERAQREAEASAAATQERMNAAVLQAQAEGKAAVVLPVNEFFGCVRDSLVQQREAVKKVFEASVAQVEAALGMMAAQGAQDAPEAAEYRASIAALKLQSEEEIAEIDAQVARLNDEEVEFIRSVTEVAEVHEEAAVPA